MTPAIAVVAKRPNVVEGLASQTSRRTRGRAALVPVIDCLRLFQRPRRSLGPSSSGGPSMIGSPVSPLFAGPESAFFRRPIHQSIDGGPPPCGGIIAMSLAAYRPGAGRVGPPLVIRRPAVREKTTAPPHADRNRAGRAPRTTIWSSSTLTSTPVNQPSGSLPANQPLIDPSSFSSMITTLLRNRTRCNRSVCHRGVQGAQMPAWHGPQEAGTFKTRLGGQPLPGRIGEGMRDPGVASVRPVLDDDQGAARTQHFADGF